MRAGASVRDLVIVEGKRRRLMGKAPMDSAVTQSVSLQ